MTPAGRGVLLYKLAGLIEENLLVLASIESLDNGKSITMAKGDVGGVAATLRYYAGWADKIHGKVVDTQPDRVNFIKHEPIGVCGQIIPWNFPLLMVRNDYSIVHFPWIQSLTLYYSSHGKLHLLSPPETLSS